MSIFCLFIRVYDVIYVLIQFNRSKLCNFISSWKMVKNTIKLYYRRCFIYKSNKNAQKTRGDIFYAFADMTSFTLNAKLCNFITSWNLIKAPQNFVQRSFSIQLTKIWYKNRGELWPQFPFKNDNGTKNYLQKRISCF